jgi:putative transposase
VVTFEHKEQCVSYAKEKYTIKHARACKLFNCSRAKKYYEKKMPLKDAPVKAAIEKVIKNKKRGRKKVIKMVQKENPDFSKSRIRRIYEQNGFALAVKPKRRKINHLKNPIEIPFEKNKEWAIDFMYDTLANKRQIRSLNIIDHFNRECKGINIQHSFPAVRVIEYLEEIICIHGKPERIRTDNGPEFISKKFQLWLRNNKIEWSKIEKGCPQQNAIIERFNRTVREDLLDANLFLSLEHANDLAEDFKQDYNCNRPHESLNEKTPSEYAA